MSPSRTKRSTSNAEQQVDRQLEKYRTMRDFSISTEPAGANVRKKESKLPFVIQKHAASHLHYDFRLGWNGVLKSWAIAKGPSCYPGDKRLAIQVEDHPIEYGGFEGIIPQGQYGGGTVMIWDHGTWEPQPGHANIDDGQQKGSIKFILHGSKLKGKWALVRMGGSTAPKGKPHWLLIKEHDEFARTANDPPVTEEMQDSAVTGRSLEQIRVSAGHVWGNNQPGDMATNTPKQKAVALTAVSTARKSKAPRETLPEFIRPQLAQLAYEPPTTSDWMHEIKLDGYRIEARIHHGDACLLTRTGLDWTHRLKPIADALRQLSVNSALLDGEVCALRSDGTTSFADLQASFEKGEKHSLTYFVFDLLHLDGRNLRGLPLADRKTILGELITSHHDEKIRFSDHLEGSGATIFTQACKLHAEGIISKRADQPYFSGRNRGWLKLKCIHQQELVIGGYTRPTSGIHGIGALLLGYYDSRGRLIYAGRSGSGFNTKTHKLVRDRLDSLRQRTMPFFNPPADARKNALWIKPEVVAQIAFANWTADALVRQAVFHGIREDKPAKEVRREEFMPIPKQDKHRKNGTEPIATVHLTHPDKILDANSQLTKGQLAEYYWSISEAMLPYIEDRPLALVRCPEGSSQPCFFQKHVNHMLPPGIESVPVPNRKTGQPEQFITLRTREALAGLAQLGVLEVHPWQSHNHLLTNPDQIVIDLDPDGAIDWPTLAESAADLRVRLKKANLECFLKTTGGKGLHVVAPIQPEFDFATVKQWVRSLVQEMAREHPELYLITMTKAARVNKIYLDYQRNEWGATAVAPYSPRARKGANAAVPLHWNELKLGQPPVFPLAEFADWNKRLRKDPWRDFRSTHQRLKLL